MILKSDGNRTVEEIQIDNSVDSRKELEDLRGSFKKLFFILSRFADVLSFQFDYEKVVDLIMEMSGKFIQYKSVLFFSYVDDAFNFYKSDGELVESITDTISSQIKEGVLDWVISSNRPAMLPADFIISSDCAEISDSNIFIIVPLIAQSKNVGLVVFDSLLEENEIKNEDLDLLSILATEGAVALSNALLYQEMEKKNVELAKVKTNLMNIYDSLTTGLLIINLEGSLVRSNSKASELLEIPIFDFHLPYKDIFGSKIINKIEKLIDVAYKKGKSFDFDLNHLYINSSGVPVGFAANKLFDENGDVAGIILSVHDMSESKELQELKEVDKIKTELISNVSHELRTPLTSIKAYTETLIELLGDQDFDIDSAREFLNTIDEESERLTGMICDLLDLSKLESGKVSLSREKFDIAKLIEKVNTLLIKLAVKKSITIDLEVDENIDTLCWGDVDKIRQVMINLISNAIKYNNDGGTIKILLKQDDDGLRCVVKDNGFGIPEKDVPFIFDKFFRVDSSFTSEVSGSGIGLSIVKAIIEAHGGNIKINSREGEGSEFYFNLPTRK
ncbi:hypothetical protein KAJ27_02955 [bacterium]|nr:hypothetical protein [bacterium]